MLIITAVSADGQQYVVTCEQSEVAKQVKIMQNKKLLHIKVNSDS